MASQYQTIIHLVFCSFASTDRSPFTSIALPSSKCQAPASNESDSARKTDTTLLIKGKLSKEIGSILNISKQIVDTQKKMVHQNNLSNTGELIGKASPVDRYSIILLRIIKTIVKKNYHFMVLSSADKCNNFISLIRNGFPFVSSNGSYLIHSGSVSFILRIR